MRRQAVADKTKRKDRKDKVGASPSAAKDQPLVSALKALRAKLAAEANVPPYVIFHDKTLLEVATQRPLTEAALAGISGLGTRKIARYGAALIDTVTRFKPHPLLDNRLSATVNQTLALHVDGKDAAEIAVSRGLELSTVYGHFAEAIEAGLVEARAVISLDEEEIDEILATFERLGTLDSGKLGPAHAALAGRFDYGTLKCLLAELS